MAGHLLGKALLAQQRPAEAVVILEKTLALRRRLGDSAANETASLLALLVPGREHGAPAKGE
jgi:hypothetical protein